MYNTLAGMLLSLSVLTQPEEDLSVKLRYKPIENEDDMDFVLKRREPRDGWLGEIVDRAEDELAVRIDDRFGSRVYVAAWLDSKFDRWDFERRMRERGFDVIERSFKEAGINFAQSLAVTDSVMDYGLDIVERVYGRLDESDLEPEDTTERIVHRSWWKRVRESGFDWGARPFRRSPYAFMSFTLGETDGEPILYSHIRYHYERLIKHRAEALVVVPLPDQWGFAAGYTLSHDPRIGDGDSYVTLRLERKIGSAEIYAGASLGNGNNGVAVGCNARW